MAPSPQRMWLMGRAAAAFAHANPRSGTGAASVAHGELARWRQRALLIEEPRLRELALAKLREEGFNAQVAAVLATGVRQREWRACVTRALVALTVLYDFLDGVTELTALTHGDDPVGDGLDVSRALVEAVAFTTAPLGNYYGRRDGDGDDGGYLPELVGVVRGELARLPASTTAAETLHAGATRCAQAQVRAHTAESLGPAQAIEWAEAQAKVVGMQARDYLAGAASSVLALHAVIAASADERFTGEEGDGLDRLYLLISVLPTLLDAVVDRDRDGFLRYYDDPLDVASSVSRVVGEALTRAEQCAAGGQHAMILAGIVGYYTSHPGARSKFARPIVRAARSAFGPLMWGVLAVLYTWRGARWTRRRHAR